MTAGPFIVLAWAGCTSPPVVVEGLVSIEPPVVSVQIGSNPDLVTEKVLEILLVETVPVELLCEAPGVEDEHHRVVTDAAPRHDIVLSGLLASTRYTCTIAAGDGQAIVTLQTEDLPVDVVPMTLAHLDPDRSHGAWTLFNHWTTGSGTNNGHRVYIVDPQGRVRWYWTLDIPSLAGVHAERHPEGILVAGGRGLPPTLVSLSGEILYRAAAVSTGPYHHEVRATENRGLITLVEAENTDGVEVWDGFEVLERDLDTDAVRWRWASQDAVDDGVLPVSVGADDPYHVNAASPVFDADGEEGVLVSLAHKDRVLWIDKGSGEVRWSLGRGQDFDLVDPDGLPLPDEQWFFGPHDPEYSPPHLLVHDNGLNRLDGTFQSRAVEYRIDTDARTATLLWEWTEPDWYEPLWGDADRLANGNVLITSGHCSFCDDVTANRRSSLIEVDPETNEVVWRLDLEGKKAGLYRAERIAGCDLFDHVGYCP